MTGTATSKTHIARGEVTVGIALAPLRFEVRRAGRRLVTGGGLWLSRGTATDHFVQLTEGVIPQEEVSDTERIEQAELVERRADAVVLAASLTDGTEARVALSLPGPERVLVSVEICGEPPLRVGAGWERRAEERLTGLGARHGTVLDQAGRCVWLGADRRYTGPDCPPEMLAVGGVPQGDYAPVPWLISSRSYAVWAETAGAGTLFDLDAGVDLSVRGAAGALRLHLICDPTPAGRLRRYCRLTGMPALLPEWAYGHWKSRDVYGHQREVEDDFDGYEHHGIALDALVLDSPWETQYNTWEFNPHQFPDPEGMLRRFRASGVRTVAWVTPWVNLESADGQKPPDPDSERLHAEPAPNYAPGAEAGHFVLGPDGEPLVARWWMGTGSKVDFTSPTAEEWWREQAKRALRLGIEGIKADDGEGFYLTPDARLADGRSGSEAAWAYGGLYRASMQRALDEVHPGSGVLFGRSGWTGQQALGHLWGGDQVSDFWSLRVLVAALLTAAASGFSNLSHDVGGYLGERLSERCPKELLLRWVELGCFSPLMQAHGRFEQEAWTYDAETLDLYRRYVLLHERLVPYVRAAAATATRCGLPIMRPLLLCDPAEPRGWAIADAFAYGPSLWVAPVLEQGAGEREVFLPRGEWIDFWTGERTSGGREVTAEAPLGRIPVWVRAGSLLVTYPAEHVETGLGDTPEDERPLEATLWGEPPLGRTAVRLADGTRIGWRRGGWELPPGREVAVERR